MTEPQISILENGLRVASWALPGLETAAVAVTAETGSRFERPELNGLAHLFEHMVFKGTKRRSARAIAEEMEDVGGQLNAWTSRDTTMFHARILARDLPLGVDLIADLVSGVRDGHASAVLAASIFHFGEVTVAQARAALADAGLPVREVFHGAL